MQIAGEGAETRREKEQTRRLQRKELNLNRGGQSAGEGADRWHERGKTAMTGGWEGV